MTRLHTFTEDLAKGLVIIMGFKIGIHKEYYEL
jgi:hypothetical protein